MQAASECSTHEGAGPPSALKSAAWYGDKAHKYHLQARALEKHFGLEAS